MKITLSRDGTHLHFLAEDPKEKVKLANFPGFIKYDLVNSCPLVLPVAYNLLQRLRKSFVIKTSKEIQDWLSQPFKLKPLPESFKFFTKPKDFQEISLRFLYTVGSAGLLLDPGMGKSKVVLDYIALSGFKVSLVVCPAALLFVWEDEIRIHRPDLTFHTVRSTDWGKELPLLQGKNVIILNYEKAVILKHRIKELKIDFMHIDEFLIKDPSTSRTKALTEISKGIPYRCGGSGTLINNTPMDGFAPIRYLQPSLVGHNYAEFRDTYCVMKDMPRPDGTKVKTPVAFKNQAEVRSILESCCIVMTKEKWLKLPPKHFHDSYVQMGVEQKEAYHQLMRNYVLTIAGRTIKVDNPLVMMAKLYQISQGFIYLNEENPDDLTEDFLAEGTKSKKISDRDVYYFPEVSKIEKLRQILTENLDGKKAIIWFNLTAELTLIEGLLKELNHEYLTIKGGDKKIGEKVRAFNRSTTTKWLVCQAKSVNYGITVLGSKKDALEKEGIEVFPNLDPAVHTEVFYSLNFSLEVFSQQQDRIHRLGQERDCDYYRLFTNSPIESKIRQAISTKMEIRQSMLVDVANTLLKEPVTS